MEIVPTTPERPFETVAAEIESTISEIRKVPIGQISGKLDDLQKLTDEMIRIANKHRPELNGPMNATDPSILLRVYQASNIADKGRHFIQAMRGSLEELESIMRRPGER